MKRAVKEVEGAKTQADGTLYIGHVDLIIERVVEISSWLQSLSVSVLMAHIYSPDLSFLGKSFRASGLTLIQELGKWGIVSDLYPR